MRELSHETERGRSDARGDWFVPWRPGVHRQFSSVMELFLMERTAATDAGAAGRALGRQPG
jgi:hypothetical protein